MGEFDGLSLGQIERMLGAVERAGRRLDWWIRNFGGDGGKHSPGEKAERRSDLEALRALQERLKAAAKTAPRDGTEAPAFLKLPRGRNAYWYRF